MSLCSNPGPPDSDIHHGQTFSRQTIRGTAYVSALRSESLTLSIVSTFLHHVGPRLSLWMPCHEIQIKALSILGGLLELGYTVSEIQEKDTHSTHPEALNNFRSHRLKTVRKCLPRGPLAPAQGRPSSRMLNRGTKD